MAVSGVEIIERTPIIKHITGIASRNIGVFCDVMQQRARELSPVGTPESTGIPGYRGGTNRQSIFVRKVDDLQFEVGTASNYGAYLELGTSKMRARPYMAPAAEAARHKLESLPKGEWS